MEVSRPHRARPRWHLELLLVVGGYVGFGLVRAAINRGNPAATDNAVRVQRLEQRLHLAIERPLNHALLAHPVAMDLTGFFYRLCLLAGPAILVWLYLAWPSHYRRLRTVLVITTLLDLPLVWLYPESPPRFALPGVVDYIATRDIAFGAGSRDPHPGLNLLAAMPSMHVAWMTWCGYAAWSVLRRRPRLAWMPWLMPLLTTFVVLATGHHYVLDVLGGLGVVALAIGLNRWATQRPASSGWSGIT